MRTTATARRALALTAVLAGLVLTGCGPAKPGSGTDAAMGNGSGPGMMGWAGAGETPASIRAVHRPAWQFVAARSGD
jgi:hypothetical protein